MINDTALDAMTSKDKKAVMVEVLKTSKQAYLACLFLLMANNDRCGNVKAILDNNYLLVKQECPQDLLAVKWLLADFKGTGKPKKRGGHKGGAAGVMFAK